MPPFKVFALDDWILKYRPKCKVTLHDSMVLPFTLQELQALDPAHEIIPNDCSLSYPSQKGQSGLRENISRLYARVGTETLDPNNILVTSGAIAANYLVLQTLLAPGDRIVAQHPTYNALLEVPRSLGATISFWRQKQVPGKGDRFRTFTFDVQELEQLLETTKPKLLILNNPSNPTGAVLNEEELRKIIDLCAKHDVMILCDEVFRFLHHDTNQPQPPSLLQLSPKNCVVTGSLSKAFALPGIRVGWIAVSPDLQDTFLEQLISSSHYTTISVAMIDQQIAEFALRPKVKSQILERGATLCMKNLGILEDWAASNKDIVTLFRATGGGTCVVQLHVDGLVIDDAEFVKRLVEREAVFVPPAGICFGDEADGSGYTELKGFVRIGLGIDHDQLKLGLAAIERVLRDWTT